MSHRVGIADVRGIARRIDRASARRTAKLNTYAFSASAADLAAFEALSPAADLVHLLTQRLAEEIAEHTKQQRHLLTRPPAPINGLPWETSTWRR